jgi:hypothetical protein
MISLSHLNGELETGRVQHRLWGSSSLLFSVSREAQTRRGNDSEEMLNQSCIYMVTGLAGGYLTWASRRVIRLAQAWVCLRPKIDQIQACLDKHFLERIEMLRGLSSDLPTCIDHQIRRRCAAVQGLGDRFWK